MTDEKDDKWKPEDFGRRAYYIEDEGDFKNRRIEVVLKVDGKQVAQMQAREPGMIALVSKLDEEGVWLEILEPGGVRYTDHQSPETVEAQQPQPWHLKLIGVKE